MKKTKFISFILSAAMACTALAVPTAVSAATLSEADVGKIIRFGTSFGVPVNYKIGGARDVDGDGEKELFIYSNKIIGYKEYSADGVADWRKSPLRKWLNSTEETVVYDEANTPSYSAQKGFLSGFSEAELSVIVPETHKTFINAANNPDGGTHGWNWVNTWPECYTSLTGEYDINTLYYVMTTDAVFIPNICDMYDYGMELISVNQQSDDNIVTASGESGKPNVWVRDGHDAGSARHWYATKQISVSNVTEANALRPCMYIKSGIAYTGSGTVSDPYVLTLTAKVDVKLTENGSETSWSDGDFKVTATLAENTAGVTAYAVIYETAADGTAKVKDIKSITADAVAGTPLEIPVTVADSANTYMKVMVFDSNGKSLCTAQTFGTAPQASETETEGDSSFYASEPTVEGNRVTISGAETNRSWSRVSIIVYKGDEIVYADQKKVASDGSFKFDFTAESAFGASGKTEIGGIYTAVISSDYADSAITKSVKIAGEKNWLDFLGYLNAGDKDTAAKVLSGDAAYEMENKSLLGRGLYTDEFAQYAIADAVAEALVNAIPDGGYTSDNITAIFNECVTYAAFDASTAEQKFAMLENSRYSAIFGSGNVVSGSAYTAVKSGENSADLFTGIAGKDIKTKLLEKVILTALNGAQNAADIKGFVEENAAVIGVTFPSSYSSLSAANLKTLYDGMLPGTAPYASYADIVGRFDTSYTAMLLTIQQSGSSNRGGGGGGGGSSFSAPAPVTKPAESTDTPKSETETAFDDVKNLTWGKDEITELTKRGIISGVSEKEFAPDNSITREQFCRLMMVAYNIKLPSDGEIKFADVKSGAWYADAVLSMFAEGYISGISEEEFGVGVEITRQDMAVILYRVISDSLTADYSGITFADEADIDAYALTAVKSLAAEGIISGYSDNTFAPKKKVTRREAAVMLYRALELLK